MRITCPDCHGSCVRKTGRRIQDTDETVPCSRCTGRGWVDEAGALAGPAIPQSDEQTDDGGIQKPRRAEGWLLVVGALILLGLLGHVMNQQMASRQAATPDLSEGPQRAPAPAPAAPSPGTQRGTDRSNPTSPAAPLRATYKVTHKHRLRDCHGVLTFTRTGLRFASDEPEDSFDVARDEVTIEGDVIRIRNRQWRFESEEGVRVERVFNDWKAGRLQAP